MLNTESNNVTGNVTVTRKICNENGMPNPKGMNIANKPAVRNVCHGNGTQVLDEVIIATSPPVRKLCNVNGKPSSEGMNIANKPATRKVCNETGTRFTERMNTANTPAVRKPRDEDGTHVSEGVSIGNTPALRKACSSFQPQSGSICEAQENKNGNANQGDTLDRSLFPQIWKQFVHRFTENLIHSTPEKKTKGGHPNFLGKSKQDCNEARTSSSRLSTNLPIKYTCRNPASLVDSEVTMDTSQSSKEAEENITQKRAWFDSVSVAICPYEQAMLITPCRLVQSRVNTDHSLEEAFKSSRQRLGSVDSITMAIYPYEQALQNCESEPLQADCSEVAEKLEFLESMSSCNWLHPDNSGKSSASLHKVAPSRNADNMSSTETELRKQKTISRFRSNERLTNQECATKAWEVATEASETLTPLSNCKMINNVLSSSTAQGSRKSVTECADSVSMMNRGYSSSSHLTSISSLSAADSDVEVFSDNFLDEGMKEDIRTEWHRLNGVLQHVDPVRLRQHLRDLVGTMDYSKVLALGLLFPRDEFPECSPHFTDGLDKTIQATFEFATAHSAEAAEVLDSNLTRSPLNAASFACARPAVTQLKCDITHTLTRSHESKGVTTNYASWTVYV